MMRLKPRSSERQGSTHTIVLALPSILSLVLGNINAHQLLTRYPAAASLVPRSPCPSLLVASPHPYSLRAEVDNWKCLAVIQSKVISPMVISSKPCYAGESSPTFWQSLCPFHQNKSLVNHNKSNALSNQQNYGDKSSAI